MRATDGAYDGERTMQFEKAQRATKAHTTHIVDPLPRFIFALLAAVARELGVNALVNMSQMRVFQMIIQNTTPSPQQRQHWLSANVCLIQQ
jgi:hypothetical protein